LLGGVQVAHPACSPNRFILSVALPRCPDLALVLSVADLLSLSSFVYGSVFPHVVSGAKWDKGPRVDTTACSVVGSVCNFVRDAAECSVVQLTERPSTEAACGHAFMCVV